MSVSIRPGRRARSCGARHRCPYHLDFIDADHPETAADLRTSPLPDTLPDTFNVTMGRIPSTSQHACHPGDDLRLNTKALACCRVGAVQRLVRPTQHRRSTFYCSLLIILDRFVIHDFGGQPCGKFSSTFVSTANCYRLRLRQKHRKTTVLADKSLFSLVIFVRCTMEIVPHYEAFLTLQVFYYPITDVEDRARGHAWELVQSREIAAMPASCRSRHLVAYRTAHATFR